MAKPERRLESEPTQSPTTLSLYTLKTAFFNPIFPLTLFQRERGTMTEIRRRDWEYDLDKMKKVFGLPEPRVT